MNLNVENCPVTNSDKLGTQKLKSPSSKNELLGQYFTPVKIAEFMASMLDTPLTETVKELLSRQNCPKQIEAHLYEIDLVDCIESPMLATS